MNCSLDKLDLVALDISLFHTIRLQVTITNSYLHCLIAKTFVVICCSLSENSTKEGCWKKEIKEVKSP